MEERKFLPGAMSWTSKLWVSIGEAGRCQISLQIPPESLHLEFQVLQDLKCEFLKIPGMPFIKEKFPTVRIHCQEFL